MVGLKVDVHGDLIEETGSSRNQTMVGLKVDAPDWLLKATKT